ncbi:hypothetical protein Nepgr_014600 [Nepenthes gracilis]|uniref:Dof zinc finger protein n=1 Tax=Nepenthes gracilis TaxID=150966 RepID=A0AAD3SL34_NEPGR|nr:hypothetical protein Nepgr_014600 [Nepenthes gracilis]
MVFSSLPIYLDPPNWRQRKQEDDNHEHPHLQPPQPQPQPQLQPQPQPPPPDQTRGVGGGTTTSIRPNSMAERARLAKIPQSGAPLKCPRCESTSTKFCYFNNYSLLQPRHFCKACRRYWTHGGALRNVPVGGSCRRNNKRSKSGRSKSPIGATTATDQRQRRGSVAETSSAVSSITELIGSHLLQPTPHLPFMTSLQNLTHLGIGNVGLNGIQVADFSAVNSNISGAAAQQWSFLGGGLNSYPFVNGSVNEEGRTFCYAVGNDDEINVTSKSTSNTAVVSQPAAEEIQGLIINKQMTAMPENSNKFWGANDYATVWTGPCGLNSSSSTI